MNNQNLKKDFFIGALGKIFLAVFLILSFPYFTHALTIPAPSIKASNPPDSGAPDRNILLNWTGSGGASKYHIEARACNYSGNRCGSFVQFAERPANETAFTHGPFLTDETYYEYRMRASNNQGEFSEYSPVSGARTKSVLGKWTGSDSFDNEHFANSSDGSFSEWKDSFSKAWSFIRKYDGLWYNVNNAPIGETAPYEKKYSVTKPSGESYRCAADELFTASCSGSSCAVTAKQNRTESGNLELAGGCELWPPPNASEDFPFGGTGKVLGINRPFAFAPPTGESEEYADSVVAGFSPRPPLEKNAYLCGNGGTWLAHDINWSWSGGNKDENGQNAWYTSGYSNNESYACPGSHSICVAERTGADTSGGATCRRCVDASGKPLKTKYDLESTAPPTLEQIVSNSARVDYDEQYVRDTIKNRFFDPRRELITPFDDIFIELKLSLCPLAGKAAPFNLPFEAAIVTQGMVIAEGAFEHKNQQVPDEAIYRWTMYGWSDQKRGIAKLDEQNDKRMETLVDSIVNRKPIELVLKDATAGASVKEKKFPLAAPSGSCVRLWGSPTTGRHGFVNMRDDSELDDGAFFPKALVASGEENRETFQNIDPFKTHKSLMSHFVDLKKHTEKLASENALKPGGFKSISTCKQGGDYMIHINFPIEALFLDGLALPGTHHILMSRISRNLYGPVLTVHEYGHSFCALNDEHTGATLLSKPNTGSIKFTNCQPKINRKPWSLYSQAFEGCTKDEYYRPSDSSIMHGIGRMDPQFNVISCGYCLNALNGTTIGNAFKACNSSSYETIDKYPNSPSTDKNSRQDNFIPRNLASVLEGYEQASLQSVVNSLFQKLREFMFGWYKL